MLAERCAALGRTDLVVCPQLPVAPKAAATLLTGMCAALDPKQLAIIGSSLGGYYATWLAEAIGCRAVLLNPAVRPQRDLAHHLGPQTVYHSVETIQVERAFLGQLDELWVPQISHPERYLLLAAKGDELLDWREMVAHYPGAVQWIIEGSDHGLSDFGLYLERVLEFAEPSLFCSS